ncbi:hypothetical protein FHS43_001632 [Streptosporangium becharense]|uniref:Ig-like domain-containing protein n=1 Tax=Streptosporangium becharense TaxID=1816182 RepID=A0A7W9IM00_9ACTN|nr:hypothetical protein [Streptosporangium becharense]MBB2910369.1 hypothetical protein [Streptosporangium becharense]MBB5823112.1 hypothetical protein [Streptosporangium becharense]
MAAAVGAALCGVLAATPAAAVAAPGGPVTVSATKASPARYNGDCPVDVGFAATIKAGPGSKVKYRWLYEGGKAGAVRTVLVKGRQVTVWDRRTFTADTRGWQALQVLGTRRKTGAKTTFRVGCHGPVIVQSGSTPAPVPTSSPTRKPEPSTPPATAQPTATPTTSGTPDPDPVKVTATATGITNGNYEGSCWNPRYWTTSGTLKVSRVPATVKYRWVDSNGWKSGEFTQEFAAGGATEVPVKYEEKVAFDTRTGWRAIEVVSPGAPTLSNKVDYDIKCTDATDAKVTVTALRPSYDGVCPPPTGDPGVGDLPFTVRIEAEKTPAIVKFRRIWNGTPGPVEEVRLNEPYRTFAAHKPITGAGTVTLAIEVNGVRSNTATSTVTCQNGPLPEAEAQVEKVTAPEKAEYLYYCGWNPDYRHYLSGAITAKGPGRVPYRWVIDHGSVKEKSAVGYVYFHGQGSQTQHAVWATQPTYNASASVWLELFPDTPKAVTSNVGLYRAVCRL